MNKKKQINVLEYGSGGSTKLFSDMLRENDTYDAIEYHPHWAKIVEKEITHKNTKIHLVDSKKYHKRSLKKMPMTEYVNYVKSLNKKYDIIFVDGRKRAQCIKTIYSNSILEENGVIFLHDTFREYYQSGKDLYPNGFDITETMWMYDSE